MPARKPITSDRFARPSRPSPLQALRTVVQRTYQLEGELLSRDGAPLEDVFAAAQDLAIRWLTAKMPGQYGAPSPEGSLHAEIPGQRVEAVGIPEKGIWAGRLVHPDAGFKGMPPVPGRNWMTDIALHRSEDSVRFGVRIQCATQPDANGDVPGVAYTRPRIVLDWIKQLGVFAPIRLSDTSLEIATEAELGLLRDLLADPNRGMPVVVLTNPDSAAREQGLRKWVVDDEALARSLTGFAHVMLLPNKLSYKWSEMVGRSWGAYHGAVRVYQPGWNPETQPPQAHPRYLLDWILGLESETGEPEKVFADILVKSVTRSAALRPRPFAGVKFLSEARMEALEAAQSRIAHAVSTPGPGVAEQGVPYATGSGDDPTRRELDDLREQVEAVQRAHREHVEEMEATADHYLNTSLELEADRNRIKAQMSGMRWQIIHLEEKLREAGKPFLTIQPPASYEELPDWVAKHLSSGLVLHPRAERSLKDAEYEDLGLVCKALHLLATEYQAMRLGLPGAKERWEAGLEELELENGLSVSKAAAEQYRDDYFVKWPLGTERNQFVKFHLRKGTSFEPRFCLAIYYFWDEDENQVVVCSLPKHLTNRLT